jgi:DNA polymerase-3 subunit beta
MITIPRKSLLAELHLLQSVLEVKLTMPVLAYVRFELVATTLTLTATSLDVSITTQIEAVGEPWSGCLPLAQLYALVKLLYDETITVTPKDGIVEIKAGRARHKLPTMSVSEFPEISQANESGVTLPAATFNSMLSSIAFAVLTPSDGLSQSQHRFTGISMIVRDNQLLLTATNIMRLATTSCAVESDASFDVIIPRQAIGGLMKVDGGEVSIGVTDSFLHFTNGLRRMHVRRLIDDKFPDWRSMFPKSYEHTAELATGELSAAIKRAMLTQNERRNMVIDGLRWTWAGGELLIETRGGDLGKSDEVVAVTCASLNGSSVALGMNGQQVIDALSLLGERVVCGFSAGTFVVKMKPQQPSPVNFTYYINTVSLKNWQ